jgi:pyruvate dehydrogenase E1 component
MTIEAQPPVHADLDVLETIERRVLWLATTIVHHANRIRVTPSGVKVGGHQASSASITSIMTALYFHTLRREDRVSVKPHAAPVLHAIEYLLGLLDETQLTTLRAYRGLQSYPSRLKDPVPADFSTGSVGIGATAPIWSAVANRYVRGHFEVPAAGRQISLVGDAELDEGACWEAILDPMVSQLGEVMWIVDLNRQSLDRVVPNLAANRLATMFEAAGWNAITVKYGRKLESLFAEPRGEALRRRIDEMPNEEYQRLLQAPAPLLRERLPGDGGGRDDIQRIAAGLDDEQLRGAIRDLGGHDLGLLLDAFSAAEKVTDRPTVIFAYTIKARSLPTEGHPGNHSALLTDEQWEQLAGELGADPAAPWQRFSDESPEGAVCRSTALRLGDRGLRSASPLPALPIDLGRPHTGNASTQQAFGRFFVDLAREASDVARHVVTVSPDVASSTNLGGWINRVGIWNPTERPDWFSDDSDMLVRWSEGVTGQHIELGIAEVNLVSLLGELGSTWSRDGQPLIPIGTLYDPFVTRALEPWSFGIYSGGQSILVGTPSGVTLAPEGGAHQSIMTPSIGIEQPQCVAWEPAYGQDLEWALLHAMGQLGRPGGSSAYFRLTTRPMAQAPIPADAGAREERRRAVLAGGYRLSETPARPQVTLVGVGALMPEVIAAAEILENHGIGTDVVCLTSPDLVFRALQARQGLLDGSDAVLDELFPSGRATPIVAVLDGHPHTLAFLSAVRRQAIACLGVHDFGQSGDIGDLYEHFGIDVDTIVGAAFDLFDAGEA